MLGRYVRAAAAGLGFDAILRQLLKSPGFPSGRLQPSLTVGPAILVAHADSTNFEPSTPLFAKSIAVFGEYRYTHSRPELTFRDDILSSANRTCS